MAKTPESYDYASDDDKSSNPNKDVSLSPIFILDCIIVIPKCIFDRYKYYVYFLITYSNK